MPGVGEAQVLLGAVLRLEDDDFLVARQAGDERVDVQVAEAAAELDLLFGSDVLVPEEHHQVVQQRLLDLPVGFVVQRLPEVHAVDDGSERA